MLITPAISLLTAQYADDTKILYQDHLEKLANTTLKNSKIYFLHNGLMVTSETLIVFSLVFDCFCHIPEDAAVQFDGTSISPRT